MKEALLRSDDGEALELARELTGLGREATFTDRLIRLTWRVPSQESDESRT